MACGRYTVNDTKPEAKHLGPSEPTAKRRKPRLRVGRISEESQLGTLLKLKRSIGAERYYAE